MFPKYDILGTKWREDMKKDFNLSKMSIVGIVCASIAMPAFAASSVRSLGGAGTISGTSSVRAGAASETSGSALTAARAGTVRVNSGTRVNSDASLRTPSTRAATAPRLSIGKYLSGSSALSGGSSVRPGQSGTGGGTIDTEGLRNELQNLLGEEIDVTLEGGDLYIEIAGKTVASGSLATQDSIDKLQAQVDDLAAKGGDYTGDSTYISIDADNTVSAIIGALSVSEDEMKAGLATTEIVKEYAIPKPSAACADEAVCVLSTDGAKYYWLQLVDTPTVVDGQDDGQDDGSVDDLF